MPVLRIVERSEERARRPQDRAPVVYAPRRSLSDLIERLKRARKIVIVK